MDTVSAPQQQSPKPNNTALWLIGGIGCGVIVIGAVVLLFRVTQAKVSLPFHFGNNSQSQTLIQTNKPKPTDAIMSVGNEFIYQQDLEFELKYAPGNDPDKQKIIEKKLIQDSIILQGAEADKLITLNSEIYNSPNKNYINRIAAVKNAEKVVRANANRINGTVITIWYFNNEQSGTLNYKEAKEFALKKVTELHDQVRTRKQSITQVLEFVKKDDSLKQITPEHNANAGFTFDTEQGEGPTMDDKFNKLIWSLQPGQLSQVVTIQDNTNATGKPIDALYAFAQIEKKSGNGAIPNYEIWLKDKTKSYGVTYY